MLSVSINMTVNMNSRSRAGPWLCKPYPHNLPGRLSPRGLGVTVNMMMLESATVCLPLRRVDLMRAARPDHRRHRRGDWVGAHVRGSYRRRVGRLLGREQPRAAGYRGHDDEDDGDLV